MENVIDSVSEIDGIRLHKIFSRGGYEIIRDREYINSINVFPVADGDTGTNLSNTMRALMLYSRASESVEKTMDSIARAVITGARGNSGLIMSEFFSALSESAKGFVKLKVDDFARIAREAAGMVPGALENPQRGTILTVFEGWSESLTQSSHLENFTLLFNRGIEAAEKALGSTTNLNSVLKEAGVVDAGGYAFLSFLKGCLKSLENRFEKVPLAEGYEEEEIIEDSEQSHNYKGAYPVFRYCTEALLEGNNIDKKSLRKDMEGYGNSIVVTGSGSLTRFHLHTDRPDEVMKKTSGYGTFVEQKVDDMRLEYDVVNSRKYPVALVTDSSCDLPPEFLEKYQIHVVPINIIVGENSYLDRLTVRARDIFSLIDSSSSYPRTSQPSVNAFKQLYSFLLSHYESVISVHISGKASGTFQSAVKAADYFRGGKIDVIDSLNLSGSLGLVVYKAAGMIDSGMEHDEIREKLLEIRKKARIFVSVKNLKYMVRGGRVSPLKGFAAKILNLKPVISLDSEGKSVLYGKTLFRETNDKKILEYVKDLHNNFGVEDYAVTHSGIPGKALEIAREVEKITGKSPLHVSEISPVISLNSGPGAYSVVLMLKESA